MTDAAKKGLGSLGLSLGELMGSINLSSAFGFAVITAWLPQFFNIMNVETSPYSFAYKTNYFHIGTLLLTSVVLIAYTFFPQKAKERIGSGAYDTATTALLTFVSVILPLLASCSLISPQEMSALLTACMTITCAPIALIYVRWGMTLGRLDSLQSFMSLLAAYAIVEIGLTFLGSLNWLPLVVANAALPVLSNHCLKKCREERAEIVPNIRKDADSPWSKRFFAKFGACLMLLPTVSMTIRHYCLGVPSIYSAVALSPFAQAFSTLLTIALILVYGVLLSFRKDSFDFRSVYGMTFLVLLAAALFLPLASAETLPTTSFILQNVADQAFCLLMWFVYAAMCRSNTRFGIRFFPAMLGCRFFGTFAGMVLGETLSRSQGINASYSIAVCGVLVTAFVYTFVFNEKDAVAVGRVIPLKTPSPFKERCRLVGYAYGLSPREQEIMFLIAVGNDSASIQKKLYISAGTVNTHRMHIYQKLDVHSKTELVELVEGFTPDNELRPK